ncbi:transporter [Sphingopyxis chilensis]
MASLSYTFLPVATVVLGAFLTLWRSPSEALTSAMQHVAAGAIFATAATEILPQVIHAAAPNATFIGGALGIAAMLLLKALEGHAKGAGVLLGVIGIDILIAGLVLGLAFIAGERTGLLLAIGITLEVLVLTLLLPLGALLVTPLASVSPLVISGFLSFGLMALLYLVTEELLAEARWTRESPVMSAMFFAGFLSLVLIEEAMA